MSHDDDTEYELVMPFVAVTSKGGPYDDDAFVAGHATGVLWMRLAAAKALEAMPITATVRRALVGQCDLMAMHYELAMTVEDMDPEIFDAQTITEWATITFDHVYSTLEGPPA